MEYKRQVEHSNPERLRSLATQMSFRLDEGQGRCVYRLGVEDDGCHSLLGYADMAESARVLECIARTLNAIVAQRTMIQNEIITIETNDNNEEGQPVHKLQLVEPPEQPHVFVEPSLLGDARGQRMITEQMRNDRERIIKNDGYYTRAEIVIQRIETHILDLSEKSSTHLAQSLCMLQEKTNHNNENDNILHTNNNTEKAHQLTETLSTRNIRVAVVGNVDAGKSTMIGTLTTSSLDDGRGLCRTAIMKHRHEIESGRTSTTSSHLMGFRSTGEPIGGHDKIRGAKRKSEDEVARESYRVITLTDLAGHEKYLKTT